MTEPKFETAMERLEKIVQSLEGGELPLEESLKVFEEGMKLAKFCSKKLEEAERKVTILVRENNGAQVEVPFQLSDKEDAGQAD